MLKGCRTAPRAALPVPIRHVTELASQGAHFLPSPLTHSFICSFIYCSHTHTHTHTHTHMFKHARAHAQTRALIAQPSINTSCALQRAIVRSRGMEFGLRHGEPHRPTRAVDELPRPPRVRGDSARHCDNSRRLHCHQRRSCKQFRSWRCVGLPHKGCIFLWPTSSTPKIESPEALISS